jgi:hypothetical protein
MKQFSLNLGILRSTACCLILGLLLTLGCGKNPAGPGNMISFETIRIGSEPLPSYESFHGVIRDRASWETLWTKYFSDPLPIVDFQQSTVLAVFLGSSPCDGIEIQTVEDLGSRWIVQVTVWNYLNCVLTVFAQNYHLVRIPRTDLPVEFVFTQKVRSRS